MKKKYIYIYITKKIKENGEQEIYVKKVTIKKSKRKILKESIGKKKEKREGEKEIHEFARKRSDTYIYTYICIQRRKYKKAIDFKRQVKSEMKNKYLKNLWRVEKKLQKEIWNCLDPQHWFQIKDISTDKNKKEIKKISHLAESDIVSLSGASQIIKLITRKKKKKKFN